MLGQCESPTNLATYALTQEIACGTSFATLKVAKTAISRHGVSIDIDVVKVSARTAQDWSRQKGNDRKVDQRQKR